VHVSRSRLFFALWPDDHIRQQLWALSCSLGKNVHHAGKPVAPENLHITLAFLGVVDDDMRECAVRVAAAVQTGSFVLTLDRVGYWGRPRIQWLGCEPAPVALQGLVGMLNQQLISCGYQPETRSFVPHITLRRKSRPLPRDIRFDPIRWHVRDFCLVESVTHEQGPEYRVLESWSLGR
jgi:2'-5' RNA ligase